MRLILFLALSSFGCASVSPASSMVQRQIASSERLKTIVGQLNQIFQCPERIWPDLPIDDYRLLFTKPSMRSAWMWTAKDRSITLIPSEELTPQLLAEAPYQFVERFRGERFVSINLDQLKDTPGLAGTDRAMLMGFHEGFHFLFQFKEPWMAVMLFSGTDQTPDRSALANAIYARKMIKRSLRRELVDHQSLGATAFWRAKLRDTGLDKMTALSDVLEGTAYYVENIASVIAMKGCSVGEEEIVETVRQGFGNFWPDHGDALSTSIAMQLQSPGLGYQPDSYEIGLMSLLDLRFRKVSLSPRTYGSARAIQNTLSSNADNASKLKAYNELQAAAPNTLTPLDLLLTEVHPHFATEAEDPAFHKEIEAAVAKVRGR